MINFVRIALIISLVFASVWSSWGMDVSNGLDDGQNSNIFINIECWSKEEILNLLTEEQYEESLNIVINNLEQTILAQSELIKISKPNQLLSLFLAYYNVNLSIASFAAKKASSNALNDISLQKAWLAGYKVIYNAKTNFDEVEVVLNCLLEKLEINDPEILGLASWQLSQLLFLIHIAKPEFQDLNLRNSYEASLNVLDNDPEFTRSQDEVFDLIANETWSKPKLADNPYIISLKNILDAVRPQDSNSPHHSIPSFFPSDIDK